MRRPPASWSPGTREERLRYLPACQLSMVLDDRYHRTITLGRDKERNGVSELWKFVSFFFLMSSSYDGLTVALRESSFT